MELYLSVELNDKQIHRMRELSNSGDVHVRTDYDERAAIDTAFPSCEVVFGNVPPTWLVQTNKLRWVQLESVGFGEYRHLDWSTLEKQIALTNLAGFFADPVAQSILAGILAHYRGINQLVSFRQNKTWIGDPMREHLRSLTQASVVLFGFGSINQRLAELLKPYHCNIRSFNSHWTASGLDTALTTADIVVCTAPETDATTGVFDHARLQAMKSGALFINAGRGSVVDEDALATALNDHHLGGAVIDVTLDEPLPAQHPFWTTPNTILTQHSGGGTWDELDRKIDFFADNLTRYRAGQTLLNIVDFQRGY